LKRYGAIILGILFVLGMAASAFAIHAEIPAETQAVVAKGQTLITLGGDIRFRGTFDKNLGDQLDGGSDDHRAYIDQRVRLRMDIKASEKTSARIHIEHVNTWGDGWRWGDSAWDFNDNAKGVFKVGNYKEADDFSLVEAWINHDFGSFSIKAGHMPLALGYKLFFDHTKEGDDAIVIYGSSNNVHWAGVVAKFSEGHRGINDDTTAYAVLASYKGDNFNISGDIVYVDSQSGIIASNPALAIGSAIHGWNFGFRGDFNLGGVKVKGDIELQTGTLEESNGAVCTANVDCDFKGYAFMIGAEYGLGNTKLTLEYFYGSGDDNPNDSDLDMFVTSLSAVQYGPYIYGYKSSDTASGGPGISNLQRLSFTASTKVSKDLSLTGAIHWLKAAEDVSINGATADDDLGWEIDGKVVYMLDKNLKYWIEGGVLFTGDAYDYPTQSADDMYSIRHGLLLSF